MPERTLQSINHSYRIKVLPGPSPELYNPDSLPESGARLYRAFTESAYLTGHMKSRFSFLVPILFLLLGCGNPDRELADQKKELQQLRILFDQKEFFQLRSYYDGDSGESNGTARRYQQALTHTVFNQPGRANALFDSLLADNGGLLNNLMKRQILAAKITNYVKLFEYGKALSTGQQLLHFYGRSLEAEEASDLENELKIWAALKDVGKQIVSKTGPSAIPFEIDKAGLKNIEVRFPGDASSQMVFDTGANFSTVKRSLAQELGFRIIPSGFEVGTLTGTRVNSDIAVADRLQIGEMTFRNVVFLVFDDQDLHFPPIDYQIHGIIGLPVIEAMGEIRLSNALLTVPLDTGTPEDINLALDGFNPLVLVRHGEDEFLFGLDTGANTTSLFHPFYEHNREEMDARYQKDSVTLYGAGGRMRMEGFNDVSVRLAVGDAPPVQLDSLQLITTDYNSRLEGIYGNLGQDFTSRFEQLIINFQVPYIKFR